MALEENEFDGKVFEGLSILQIELFKKLLEEHNITYEVMQFPCDMMNGITYEASSHTYSNYNEFITDLNTKNVAEIYLYKVSVNSDRETGSMFYTIRYVVNRDLIANKTIKDIKKLFGFIKSNKNVKGISADKIKRILQKHFVSEEASRNVVKLIRVLEKEILMNKTGAINE